MVFFHTVIQGSRSLLTWISIIPSPLPGTEREGGEGTETPPWKGISSPPLSFHWWEPVTWSHLILTWTGNYSPQLVCCPLETNLWGGVGRWGTPGGQQATLATPESLSCLSLLSTQLGGHVRGWEWGPLLFLIGKQCFPKLQFCKHHFGDFGCICITPVL